MRLYQTDGLLLWEKMAHKSKVASIDFSPDGRWIVSGAKDKTIKLWSSSGKLLDTYTRGIEIDNVIFSYDGKGIMSVGIRPDGYDFSGGIKSEKFYYKVQFHRINKSRIEKPFNYFTYKYPIQELALIPEGKLFAILGLFNLILRNSKGELIKQFSDDIWKNKGYLANSLAISPDGNKFLIGFFRWQYCTF